MADSPYSNSNPAFLPPPPSSSSPRHVAFTELPPKHSSHDYESRRRRTRPRCFSCGVRTFVFVFVFFLVLTLIAAVFVSLLFASLPRVQVRRLQFPDLRLSESGNATTGKVHLTAATDIVMAFRNRNGVANLRYGQLSVRVWWQDVDLGKTEIGAFDQEKDNTTSFSLRTRVDGQEIDAEDYNELQSDLKKEQGVFHLALRGDLTFKFGNLNINSLPTSIKCDPQKEQIDLGRRPRCTVRLFPV